MLNLLVAFLLCFQDPQEPQFPPIQGAINDFAHILVDEDIIKLREKCAALRDSGGAAVVVCTTPSLYGLNVEDYANQLFKKWGIGKKKEDNGVLILIAPNEKKVRIEVGYGNESRLTDLEAKAIITDVIRPLFRAGKVSESIVAGTEAVLAKLGGTTTAEPIVPVHEAPVDWSILRVILGIIGIVLVIWFLVWSGLGEVLLPILLSTSGGRSSSTSGGGGGGGSRRESSSSGGGSSGGGGASGDL